MTKHNNHLIINKNNWDTEFKLFAEAVLTAAKKEEKGVAILPKWLFPNMKMRDDWFKLINKLVVYIAKKGFPIRVLIEGDITDRELVLTILINMPEDKVNKLISEFERD